MHHCVCLYVDVCLCWGESLVPKKGTFAELVDVCTVPFSHFPFHPLPFPPLPSPSPSPPLPSSQLKKLNLQQLEEHMHQLDNHLDQELESLRQRYHSKREPILAAMDAKKRQTRM